MLTGPVDLSQGGLVLEDTPSTSPRFAGRHHRVPQTREPAWFPSRALHCSSSGRYERVVVNSPHAVNSMVTVALRPPRITTMTTVPASNRGAAVQLAL